jgi:regulatory LuxR family protein
VGVNLSIREHTRLSWVALGKSSRDIGDILEISADTVIHSSSGPGRPTIRRCGFTPHQPFAIATAGLPVDFRSTGEGIATCSPIIHGCNGPRTRMAGRASAGRT